MTKYVARSASAAAERYVAIKGVPTKKQLTDSVRNLFFDINAVYKSITGRTGSVTTDPDSGRRTGQVIGFTQAVLRLIVERLPEKPAMPRDASMRSHLSGLAGNPAQIAETIHEIRLTKWERPFLVRRRVKG